MIGKIKLFTLDYIILTAFLSVSTGFGIFYGCFGTRQSTSEEIHLGTRQMNVSKKLFLTKISLFSIVLFLLLKHIKVLPVSMSLISSFISSLAILGLPAEVYVDGTIAIWSIFSYLGCCLITANVFLPFFHGLKLKTSYEV